MNIKSYNNDDYENTKLIENFGFNDNSKDILIEGMRLVNKAATAKKDTSVLKRTDGTSLQLVTNNNNINKQIKQPTYNFELDKVDTKNLTAFKNANNSMKSLDDTIDKLKKEISELAILPDRKKFDTDKEFQDALNKYNNKSSIISNKKKAIRNLNIEKRDAEGIKLDSKQNLLDNYRKSIDNINVKMLKDKGWRETDITELKAKWTKNAGEFDTSVKNSKDFENFLSQRMIEMDEIQNIIDNNWQRKFGIMFEDYSGMTRFKKFRKWSKEYPDDYKIWKDKMSSQVFNIIVAIIILSLITMTGFVVDMLAKSPEKPESFTNTITSETPATETPATETKNIEDYTLEDIKKDINKTISVLKNKIDEKGPDRNSIGSFEEELKNKIEFYDEKTDFTFLEIFNYLNIPTNIYQMTLEQLVAFVDTSSRNEVIKKKKLDYYLVARDMYKRLNDEEKEKFLLFDSKTQDKIIRIFIEETKKTINKEIKEINEINKSNDNIKNNEIKEKTILQKYLLFIIIGVIIIFCVFIVLINENKKL
jgi:hypothetical protein